MEVLKILFNLAALQVVWNISGTEGLFNFLNHVAPVAHTDDYRPLDHFREKREVPPKSRKYIIEVNVTLSDITAIDQVMLLLGNFFPYEFKNISFTNLTRTTVCSPKGGGFQCKCEEDFTWPLGNCNTYGNCSDIIENTCGCINGIPPTGQFCSPKPDMTTTTAHPTSSTGTPVHTSMPNTTMKQTSVITPSRTTTPQTTTKTPTVITPSRTTTPQTTTQMPKFELKMSLTINQDFTESLTDPTSADYMGLSQTISNAVDENYRKIMRGYIGVTITGFRSGSVITDFIIGTDNITSSVIQTANARVTNTLAKQSLTVDENSFTAAINKDGFSGVNNVFSGSDMVLACDAPGRLKTFPAKWRVNSKEIKNNNTKYIINTSPPHLIVRNVVERDSGEYECEERDGIVVFLQKGNIEVRRAIVMLTRSRINVPCITENVEVECCVKPDGFPAMWTENDKKLEPVVESPKNDFKCYKHDYLSQTQNDGQCVTRSLFCIMTINKRNFTQKAEINFFNEEVNCNDDVYGSGNQGSLSTTGCPEGYEGNRTARCDSNTWKLVEDNCVLSVIIDLQEQSEDLTKDDVSVFLDDLSQITKDQQQKITNSSGNIRAIVDILNNVANVSEAVTETVMTNFLETVDVLIKATKDSWDLLNENNNTKNTSAVLLGTVEILADVLSDEDFTISNISSIELRKTTFSDTFSTEFNSTAQIFIPDPQLNGIAQITTIRFLGLDNVLPPRNITSSNNTINGAVLLVNTNATVTNVSLSFEITNTSEALGNPQCVFWNFTLFETEGGWDSTGCTVQSGGNESVTCVCNHLTSFSILMSPFIPPEIRLLLDFITYIGVGISMGSLVLCLIIEAFVWTVVARNDTSYMRHVAIVNTALSLLIANIWFIIGAAISDIDQKTPVGPCSAATFFIHFFYLALFFWMLISGLLLFHRMVMVFSDMSRATLMVIAFSIGYGAPLIIAVITVAVTAPQDGYFRQNDACWLNWFQTKALLAFVIPALTIVAINFLILIVVLYKVLRRGVGENQPDEKNALVVIARCVAFLTPFFGLTWGFGIGTMVDPESVGIHIVFAVLNSLQGFFVLVFGTLLDGRIRAAIAGRFSFIHTRSNRTRSTSAGPSSSSGLGLFRRHRRDAYQVSAAASSSHSTGASESFLNT